jgi:hypothetical protein
MGVLWAAGRNRALRVAGWALVAVGVVDRAGPFFPMHTREVLAVALLRERLGQATTDTKRSSSPTGNRLTCRAREGRRFPRSLGVRDPWLYLDQDARRRLARAGEIPDPPVLITGEGGGRRW